MFTSVRVLSDNGPMRVELARWQDQLVVVKRLQGDSAFFNERLEREAAVVKKLKHDNIVPLLATEGDALIYAYYKGMTLGESLEKGILKSRQAVKITVDILSALAYAHSMGVIHCDVKPSNILLEGDRALLTDFGFAKDLALTAITQQGTFMGTPNYMAPEQFRGERRDPRLDLYATGAVLYHMLTGVPPYEGQVLRFLAGDTRLKLKPVPDEGAHLQDFVCRALTYNPDERFETAEAMLGALLSALS